VLRGVDLHIAAGEAYGLVGESGCGKSTLAFAAVRYLPENGRVRGGRIMVDDADVMAMTPAALRQMRAHDLSMVYQDPAKALNPSLRIGVQLAEAFAVAGRGDTQARALDMLRRVRIADPERVMRAYPHQLSGGMLQRVVIGMALASDPRLLILDEPTTGLDAKVEAEILELLAALRRESGVALLFISHNLAIIRRMCDRIGVLYAGELVEEGPVSQVLEAPRHPYTVGLLRCLPQDDGSQDDGGKTGGMLDTIPGFPPRPGDVVTGCIFADRCGLATRHCIEVAPPAHAFDGRMSRCHYHDRAETLPAARKPVPRRREEGAAVEPFLCAENLSKTFSTHKAVDGVSLALRQGETLGLIGESGSGKTTLARMLAGLVEPDADGRLTLDASSLGAIRRRSAAAVQAVQMVFQNPDSALNRAHSVGRIIGRALTRLAGLAGAARQHRTTELAHAVRLPEAYLDAKPRQLSGGLKQRVAVARAFAGKPRLVLCDEPTSSLDVSVQASILNLLGELQRQNGVAYLFVSHDLAVIRHVADRIAVLYRGQLVEIGSKGDVLAGPRHPYTDQLFDAQPVTAGADVQADRSTGGRGCIFRADCPAKLGAICDEKVPEDVEVSPGHLIRCHAFV
jgi:peptide/nickel transport system ATP-binding protein